MSRYTVIGHQYTFVYGLDHFTGPFVQLWKNPEDYEELPIFKIDSFGVVINLPEEFNKLHDRAQRYVNVLKKRLTECPGHHIGAIHVCELASLIRDFENFNHEVYKAFD